MYLLPVLVRPTDDIIDEIVRFHSTKITVLADRIRIIFIIALQQDKMRHVMLPPITVASVFIV